MNNQTFGTTIAALRKAQGMTQLELAERWGLPIRPYQNGSGISPSPT